MAWFTYFWAVVVVMHMVLLSSFFKAGRNLAGEEDDWHVWRLGCGGDRARSCWGNSNMRSLFGQEEEIPYLEILLSRSPAGIRVLWRSSNDLPRVPWVFHLPRHFKDAVFRQTERLMCGELERQGQSWCMWRTSLSEVIYHMKKMKICFSTSRIACIHALCVASVHTRHGLIYWNL